MGAFLLALSLLLSPDTSALSQPIGAWVSGPEAALRPPYVPLNAVPVDLDLDGKKESAVLFGAADDSGSTRPTGLLLLSARKRVRGRRVEGVVRFATRPRVVLSFASRAQFVGLRDLDADGQREIVTKERLAEPGVSREVFSWWSPVEAERGGFRLLHTLESDYRDDGVPGGRRSRRVTRKLKIVEGVRPVELVERVSQREGGRESSFEQHYRLDGELGRFVPVK